MLTSQDADRDLNILVRAVKLITSIYAASVVGKVRSQISESCWTHLLRYVDVSHRGGTAHIDCCTLRFRIFCVTRQQIR